MKVVVHLQSKGKERISKNEQESRNAGTKQILLRKLKISQSLE